MKTIIDSIIFDMDGTLIDVTKSYNLAIIKTVEYFSKTTVTKKDIQIIKSVPGFNNDWDVSFELISLLSKNIKRDKFFEKVKVVQPQLQKSKKYLYIIDVFQSYYLGNELFIKCYKRNPPVIFKNGLIKNESLLINKNLLKTLSKLYLLGVATSRPRFEALFALENFKIMPDFIKSDYVAGQEDSLREKPFPDPLLRVKEIMRVKKPVYVGDSVNDVIAAREAKMQCIFIGNKKLGDIQIENVNKLKEVIL